MKKLNYKILIGIVVFFIIIFIGISTLFANIANSSVNTKIYNEKINSEIRYIDLQIIQISNLLNESLFINWQELQENTKLLYLYWSSSVLDFNLLEVDKNILTDYGKNIDQLMIAVKNQKKQETFNSLLLLYQPLITVAECLDNNQDTVAMLYTKYYLLHSCSIVERGNWTLTQESIIKSEQFFTNILNNIENNSYNSYNINQAYVAIKELENIIHTKDLEIFYMKYFITMDKLNNIV